MAADDVEVHGGRRVLAVVLISVATLLAFLAVLSIWVNRQALNTDNWTKTSTELMQQPVVRDRVADRLTEEIFASFDAEAALREILPPRAEALAGPAVNALRTQVNKQARKALARPDVQALWADANRTAHEQLLAVLDGGGTTVSTNNGEVVLDVSRLLQQMQQEFGVGGRIRKVLPASASRVTVLRSNQLSTAQTVLRVLRPLPVFLILGSLALFGAALLVAPGWRRRSLFGYGIGFVVAGLAALLTRSLAGGQFVDSFARTAAAEPAISEVWTIATGMLVDVAVATICYGVVMIAGAVLAGPTNAATAVRRTLAPFWRVPWIAYSALAVVIVALVWWEPTPAWRNGVMLVILIGLLIAGTEALRRQMVREFPGATREEAAVRRRERWDRFKTATRRGTSSVRDTATRTAQSASGAVGAARTATVTRFATPADTRLEQLERLAQLRAAGVLDDEELRTEKARILRETPDGADADQLAKT